MKRLRALYARARAALPPWAWTVVVVVGLVVVIPGGIGGLVYMLATAAERRRIVRLALRKWAVLGNIDPDLMEALGKVEGPDWQLDARSTDPRDEARGGSYGPTQISEKTARAHGYTGSMDAFRKDPELAAQWTARIINARPGGAPTNAPDLAAWWNAGRRSWAAVPETGSDGNPHHTRAVYLPALTKAVAYVRGNPVAQEA